MDVTVYTLKGCPFCEKAKSFLSERNIKYTEIEVAPNSKEWRQMLEKTGSGTLPQILIRDLPIGGYAALIDWELSGKLYEHLGLSRHEPTLPIYDVIILGAGPAGLSASIYTARKVLKTLIIGPNIGGQVANYYDLDNYLGFSQVNAQDLVSKFEEHVTSFGIDTLIGQEVTNVDFLGPLKRVSTGDGKTFLGRTVIIAMGGRHRPLNIPGERELVGRGVSYCSTCDGPLFRGADVAVIGGGNSGLEATVDLISVAKKIYLVSLTQLTADPFLQDKVKLSPKVELLLEHFPVRILGEKAVEGVEIREVATGVLRKLDVEGVFVEIGLMPNSGLFVDMLAMNGKGEILIDTECRTGMAGVFACGDITSVPYKQVVVAAGEGAKAALSAYNYLLNRK